MPDHDLRKTFGPTVLLGLAGSGFAAVAGHRALLAVPDEFLKTAGLVGFTGQDDSVVEFPLAGALALVALACWGVLLVTRGVVRRIVAALAAVAAAGILAVVVIGGFVQDDDAAADLSTRLGLGGATVPLERSPWLWVALASALLALIAAVVAVRYVGSWPEMGTRYDAPGTDHVPAASDPEEQTNIDLWKSLDEGTDPTDA
ncbi:Trp biosynthesis-associated membrane protein [Nocardioides sp. WS12]|uniref:Trp biosynthesis-associated membrane protein n=1 Tax=Nocardioides sp. WS12 TaxID=2486272 RepID=UPI0015F9DD00|nr:Trp biosynthesis-associated membrane protein [Nocardioides sp. WS12]